MPVLVSALSFVGLSLRLLCSWFYIFLPSVLRWRDKDDGGAAPRLCVVPLLFSPLSFFFILSLPFSLFPQFFSLPCPSWLFVLPSSGSPLTLVFPRFFQSLRLGFLCPPFFSVFLLPHSLILSGLIARECQASLRLKRLWAFTPETVPKEEGDESLLRTTPFVWRE
jgi:hypothetical protein